MPTSAMQRVSAAKQRVERRIVLHCASGGRSALGADLLREMGYTNVAHLDGGLNAWKAAGRPVVMED